MALSPRRRRVLRISGLKEQRVHQDGVLRVCTVNVGTLIGKSREVVEMLARRRMDVCCVQETQYKGEGCKMLGCGDEKYKLWWSGEKSKRGGVGIMVKEDLEGHVMEVNRVNSRIMYIKMVVGAQKINIFSLYAPQAGRTEEEKAEFWGVLDDEMERLDPWRVILAGDLNGHVGEERKGFEDIVGPYGFGVRNREGERILEFCQSKGLKVINTTFKKERKRKITYKSGEVEQQLDYILMKNSRALNAKDCMVIPGEACLTQHRLLSLVLNVKDLKRMKNWKGEKKIKLWKLKENEIKGDLKKQLNRKTK